jgi:hypothetical protein
MPPPAERAITAVDVASRRASHFEVPAACSLMLPLRVELLCGGRLLFNPEIGLTTELPTDAGRVAGFSPTGSTVLLLSDVVGNEGKLVQMYDLASGEVSVFAELSAEDGTSLLNLPLLSSGGKSLAIARPDATGRDTVYLRSRSMTGWVPIGSEDFWATGEMAWSPVDSLLLYGGARNRPHVGVETTDIFVADAEERRSRHLAEAPAGEIYGLFHGAEVWSLDGRKVALLAGQQLCVVDVALASQTCTVVATGASTIRSYSWSPNGRFVALVLDVPGVPEEMVSVFSITDGHLEVVVERTTGQAVFWR